MELPRIILNLLSAEKASDAVSFDWQKFVKELWEVLSGRVALAVYIVILLTSLIFLVAVVLINERFGGDREGGSARALPEGEKVKVTLERSGATPTGEKRFYLLSQTDEKMKDYEAPAYDVSLTLPGLCEEFRSFASARLGLYYDLEDVRRFIAGLSVTHLMIMQGMSGTGKTSLAYAFGEFLQNSSVIVPIQPMWKERTDMIGYYNEFTRRFNETELLRKMYEANTNDEMYITVLDEMNIARVEYYFAEFLSLLELPDPDKRWLDVVSDRWDTDPELLVNGRIHLPENIWFIGTANNDDSTFAISDKVYDRAMVMNLDRRAEAFPAESAGGVRLSASHFSELCEEARKTYALSAEGAEKLTRLDAWLTEKFRITFGNRIMKQITQYVPVMIACGGTENGALDDILARKVLRRLESRNPVYVRSEAGALCAFLDELFGAGEMPLCVEYLRRLERTV